MGRNFKCLKCEGKVVDTILIDYEAKTLYLVEGAFKCINCGEIYEMGMLINRLNTEKEEVTNRKKLSR